MVGFWWLWLATLGSTSLWMPLWTLFLIVIAEGITHCGLGGHQRNYTYPEKGYKACPSTSETEVALTQKGLCEVDHPTAQENQDHPDQTPLKGRNFPWQHRRSNDDFQQQCFMEVHVLPSGAQQACCLLPHVWRQQRCICRSQLPRTGNLECTIQCQPMESDRLATMANLGSATTQATQESTQDTQAWETEVGIAKSPAKRKRQKQERNRQGQTRQGKGQDQRTHLEPTSDTYCTTCNAASRQPAQQHQGASSAQNTCQCTEQECRLTESRDSKHSFRCKHQNDPAFNTTSNWSRKRTRQGQTTPAGNNCSKTCIAHQLEILPSRCCRSMERNGQKLWRGGRQADDGHQGGAEGLRDSQATAAVIQNQHGSGQHRDHRLFGGGNRHGYLCSRRTCINERNIEDDAKQGRRDPPSGPKRRKAKTQGRKPRSTAQGRRTAIYCLAAFCGGRQVVTSQYSWQWPEFGPHITWRHPIIETENYKSPWMAMWSAFLDEGFDQRQQQTHRATASAAKTPDRLQHQPNKHVSYDNKIDLHIWHLDYPQLQFNATLDEMTMQSWPNKPWSLDHQEDDDIFSTMQRTRQPKGLHAIVSNPTMPINEWKGFVMEQTTIAMQRNCAEAIRYHTWYIDHEHQDKCFEPRTWHIDGAPFEWEHQLRTLWYDAIDAHQQLRIYVASPPLPQRREDGPILGHILLVQGSTDYAAVLLSSPKIHGLHYRSLIIAASTFKRSEGQHLLRLAGMSKHCDELQCTLWLYPHRLPLRTTTALFDGASIEIVPAFGPGEAQTFHDGSTIADHVSWMQQPLPHGDLIHSEQPGDNRDSVPLSDPLAVSNCPVVTSENSVDEPHQHDPQGNPSSGPLPTTWFGATHYTNPAEPHPWNTEEYPAWTTEIWQQIYAPQAEEDRTGVYTIEVYTWYIDDTNHQTCERDRPIVLGPAWWKWEDTIRYKWRDRINPDRPFNVHLIFPEPPRDSLECHQGQLLIEQIEGNNKAALITGLFETEGPKRLWRAAFSMPPRITKLDVIAKIPGLHATQAHEYLVFWHEHILDYMYFGIPHGASLVLHRGLDEEARRRMRFQDIQRMDDDDDLMNLMTYNSATFENEESTLLAHQGFRQPEDVDIYDRPDITQDPDAQDDRSDSSDYAEEAEEVGYDIDVDPDTQWTSVIIFTKQGEGIVGRMQETHPELEHREAAYMIGITANSLISLHEVDYPPDDIAAAGQKALIAQQLHDIVPGSLARMLIIDVTFCYHLPQLDVENIRQVKTLTTPTNRPQLLQLLRLDRYDAIPGQQILLRHNHQLKTEEILQLNHGDYIQLVVPPPTACEKTSTRIAALAYYHNLDSNAYPHLELRMPTGMHIDQVPNPQIELDTIPAPESVVLTQTALLLTERIKQHKNQADPTAPIRQHREHCKTQEQTLRRHLRAILPNTYGALHNALHPIPRAAIGEPQDALSIQTWYLRSTTARRCNIPRTLQLDPDPMSWPEQITRLWLDEMDLLLPHEVHPVYPNPYEMEQGIDLHVIIMQEVLPTEAGVHFTLFDDGIPPSHQKTFAAITNSWLQHQEILHHCDRDRLCEQQDVRCSTWIGWDHITHRPPLLAYNGLSVAVCVQRPQHTAYHFDPAWHDYNNEQDETTMLQQTVPSRTTICLEEAIPQLTQQTPVRLIQDGSLQALPHYIELTTDFTDSDIEEELKCWGQQCSAHRFGQHDVAFCYSTQMLKAGFHHYMYINKNTGDPEGCILHSSRTVMSQHDHMKHLYQLGYQKATILDEQTTRNDITQITFENLNSTMVPQTTALKVTTPWPPQQANRTHSTTITEQLDNLHSEVPNCQLRLQHSIEEIKAFLQTSENLLTQDLTGLELPEHIQMALTQCCPIERIDRYVIYCDGSSKSSMRRQIPDRPDDPNSPVDTWAMLVLEEQYPQANEPGRINFVGWMTQPVIYDEATDHRIDADRIGSEIAEREALIWSMMWKLCKNDTVPAAFRPDSLTTCKQAEGLYGATNTTDSYYVLRGLHQALQATLGPDGVQIHHTRGHCGDPWNDFVDIAAKTEATKSFYHPRPKIVMKEWKEDLKHLWLYFDATAGLPQLTCHGLDASRPTLPEETSPCQPPSQRKQTHQIEFCISLASANVNSLYAGPEGHAGKVDYLKTQMQSFHLNFLGIQEARTEAGSSQAQGILRLAGGSKTGQYGIELWLNTKQPIAHIKHKPIYIKPQHLVVVYADPRILLTHLVTDHLQLWLLVFHAPQSGRPAHERTEWWTHLHNIVDKHIDAAPLIVLADANATSGWTDGHHVLHNDDAPTVNTEFLRNFLDHYDLILPSTTDKHTGTNHTWYGPGGDVAKRIDYVAIPTNMLSSCKHSEVIEQLDLGHNFDHMAIAIDLQWTTAHDIPVRPNGNKAVGPKLKIPRTDIHSCSKQTLQQLQTPAWTANIEDHIHTVNQNVLVALNTHEECQCTTPKKPYITEEVWQQRKHKLTARSQLRNVNKAIGRNMLAAIFMAWKNNTNTEPEYVDTYSTTLLCWKLRATARLHAAAHKLRKKLRNSKKQHMTQALTELPATASAAQVLQTLKPYIGPTNPLKHKKAALPIVHTSTGEPCSTPQQTIDRWAQFFGDMEGGKRIDDQQQRAQWLQNLQHMGQTSFMVTTDELPSLTDLEIACRRVALAKATGPDQLPSELFHYHPLSMAKQLYTAMLKLCLHGQESLLHKGGYLAMAWKRKGPQHQCESYRSLLISCHAGKVLHRVLRLHQADIYETHLQTQQLGGRRKIPVTLTLHMARSFLRSRIDAKQSVSMIFVDLKEAFYRLLRPLVVDVEWTDEHIAHIFQRLQLPQSAMHDLRAHLRDPTATAAAHMPWHQQLALKALHLDTHFQIRGQEDHVTTTVGSRPGDSFADVIFGYAWSKLLHRLEDFMRNIGCLANYPHLHQWPPETTFHENMETVIDFMGPTWVDDLCICMTHENAHTLEQHTAQVTAALIQFCHGLAMTPNLTKGKTEIMLSLRGNGSRALRKKYFQVGASQTMPILDEDRVHNIAIVGEYIHLGGLIHHSGNSVLEMKRRLAQAHQAFTSHGRNIFRNPDIPFAKRSELFETLVLTRLLYGSETWTFANPKQYDTYHSAIMRLYKRLLRLHPQEHVTDDEVLHRAGLPHPHDLLRRQRLRYLATLHACGDAVPWGLLTQDAQWTHIMKDDLQWMYQQLHHTTKLSDPNLNFQPWRALLQHHRGYWKRLVRRASRHAILQHAKDAAVTTLHQDCLHHLNDRGTLSIPWPMHRKAHKDGHYGCLTCGIACRSKAGERVHLCRKHGVIAAHRRLFEGTQCLSCRREYHTYGRLSAHLRYSRQCRQDLRARHLRFGPTPGHGSIENAVQERQHNGLRIVQQAEGPSPEPRAHMEDRECHEDCLLLLNTTLLDHPIKDFVQHVQSNITQLIITWTQLLATMDYFIEEYSAQDIEISGVPHHVLQSTLDILRNPDNWDLFAPNAASTATASRPRDRITLENYICDLVAHPAGPFQHGERVPRPCTTTRILLHAYAGRRRAGDLQFFLDSLYTCKDGISLMVVSLDIIIDQHFGNIAKTEVRQFWLHYIQRGWVCAFVAGPPCNTWSVARRNQLATGQRGPREVRHADALWGLPSLSLKELEEVTLGNLLLAFALQSLLCLWSTDGTGLLEHPAEPDEADAPSIWRLPLMHLLLALEGFQRHRVAQGLYGAPSPKPTHFLTLNIPTFVGTMHRCRLTAHLPTGATIGKDSAGTFATAKLKEYPPGLCFGLASALIEAMQAMSTQEALETLPTDFHNACKAMSSTEYGQHFGPDIAHWPAPVSEFIC